MKELIGMQYIKQEPCSLLNEYDNKPANLSGLDIKQPMLMGQTCDADVKSELPLEESKPVIKNLVEFAPFTPWECMASSAVSFK
jgi:hypothetical protein